MREKDDEHTHAHKHTPYIYTRLVFATARIIYSAFLLLFFFQARRKGCFSMLALGGAEGKEVALATKQFFFGRGSFDNFTFTSLMLHSILAQPLFIFVVCEIRCLDFLGEDKRAA